MHWEGLRWRRLVEFEGMCRAVVNVTHDYRRQPKKAAWNR